MSSDMEKALIPKKYRKILEESAKKIEPTNASPVRAVINPVEFIKVQNFKGKLRNLKLMMKNGRKALFSSRSTYKSIDSIPSNPKTEMSADLLVKVEEEARKYGADAIGYVKLNPDFIFKDNAVLFSNVIVLTKEMDKDLIKKAPSYQTQAMILETYRAINVISRKLAEHLNSLGFGAQACPSLGGDVLMVPLGEAAGLGYHGRHGLLITPEFGPRQRLGTVFTSIENLPFSKKNEHEWIKDYCKKCGACMRACPGGAIREEPVKHHINHITHIDNSRCFPHFYKDYGCTICVKTCAFNNTPYGKLKETL